MARGELHVLHAHIDADERQDAREKAIWERQLELEKRATGLAEKERDLERTRAEFYEKALRDATRGRSVGCKIAKAFTLGLVRCR